MGGRRVERETEGGRETHAPPLSSHGTGEEEKKNGNLVEQQPQHPMKTSSPPDQKIDRSHTTTTAGRKKRNPPKPLPDLWIVHHRPQTADMQTQVRTEEGFPQTKGGGGQLMQASPPLEPALSLSGSTSSPPKRTRGLSAAGIRGRSDPIEGGSIRSRMDIHDGGDGGKRGGGQQAYSLLRDGRAVQESG